MLGICRTRVRRIPAAAGFTMIELAVAIVVIALLLGGILVPLQTQVESRKIDETQRILDQAREALIGYAAANGRFPCPASATSNGAESFAAGGSSANGNCSNFFDGFLPAATLGFTPVDAQGYALDAWGFTQNRIRYAVSNQTVNLITNPFTSVNGMRNAGMANITNAALLYVCNSGSGVNPGVNCGTAVTLTSKAPVVIWSVGPNAPTPTGGTSADEAENPNPNGGSADHIFVSRSRSEAPVFDDIVTWIGSASLFNRLIAAGQLP